MRGAGFAAALVLLGVVQAAPATAAATRVARLELLVNEQVLVPWGYLDLAYRIKRLKAGPRLDVYLAMIDGGDQCVAPESVFTAALPPFASDVALEDGRTVITSGTLPDQVSPLVTTLYGVLVAHGTSPADPANWVSNLTSLDLAMGSLSAAQNEVLAARGNPRTYLIQFTRDSRLRLDTWLYDGGPAFQFANGRPLKTGTDDERARATVASAPTAFGPGRFTPGTTPAGIRALLGDPDRVIKDSSGAQVWVFNGTNITVTVKGGLVRQVSAY